MPSNPRHIPRNLFLDQKSRYQRNKVAPLPHQIIHPFYTPSLAAELAACSREVGSKLLDGLKIVPTLLTNGKGKPLLRNRFVKFSTIKGVNLWLQQYSIRRKEASAMVSRILDDQPETLIIPSKLHSFETPLVKKLTALFGSERTTNLNPVALDSIVDELLNSNEKKLFCEDVYMYLLQHHVNSESKLIAIIQSIKSHLETDIDQVKVIEALVLQLILSVRRNELPLTTKLSDAYFELIEAINCKFHHLNGCELEFNPLVTQSCLEFHIASGNLNHSKKLLSHLILNGWAIKEDISVKYLQLIESKVRDVNRNTRILKKFAYISDFRPLIERAQTPLFFAALIPYCRHFGELYSLLVIITENIHNTKEVLDVTLLSMIQAIENMGKNNNYKSANLYELHRTVLPYYDKNLPAKFSKAFALQFAKFKNWSAVARFLKRYPSHFAPNSIASLVSAAPHNGIIDSTNYPGGVVRLRRILVDQHVLPFYSKMSPKARSSISTIFDTPKLFTQAIIQELELINAGQTDVMSTLVTMGYRNNLLRFIPVKIRDDIYKVPHLIATFESFTREIESDGVKSTATPPQ